MQPVSRLSIAVIMNFYPVASPGVIQDLGRFRVTTSPVRHRVATVIRRRIEPGMTLR